MQCACIRAKLARGCASGVQRNWILQQDLCEYGVKEVGRQIAWSHLCGACVLLVGSGLKHYAVY